MKTKKDQKKNHRGDFIFYQKFIRVIIHVSPQDLLLTLLLIRQEIVHWFGEHFNWYFVAHCDDTERWFLFSWKTITFRTILNVNEVCSILIFRTCIVTVWSHSLTIILQILTLIAALYIYGGISHWRLMSDGPLQLVVVSIFWICR